MQRPGPITHSLPPARGSDSPPPRPGAARASQEPSAKPGIRTSGGLCATPGRPPCAPLRCRLPPFCWGDPHPLPPDREGDRLPLDRWLPVFRPSLRGLGLSLRQETGEPAWGSPLPEAASCRKGSSLPAFALGREHVYLESQAPGRTLP